MRIVVWNCNMGLHAKLPALAALRPDVAVVPESADPPTLARKCGPLMPPLSSHWTGDVLHKGLSVLAFGDYSLVPDTGHDPDLKYYLPLHVHGPVSFRMLAVWAFHHRLPGGGRGLSPNASGSVSRALAHYREFLGGGPAVVAGDFNNHVCWDRPGKAGNHADMVAELGQLGLCSAYHCSRGVDQGAEPEPTLYWRNRKPDGPRYHIDYCFVAEAWRPRLRSVQVGEFGQWIGLSDHMPLVVDVTPEAVCPPNGSDPMTAPGG